MVVTLIIAILISLLMPAIMKAKSKGFQTFCSNNLKGIGLGLISYAESNDGKFPQQVPFQQGGCSPIPANTFQPGGLVARDIRPFIIASNNLGSTKILVCPRDRDLRPPASFAQVRGTNVSYFTSVRPRRNNHNTILSGDNNLTWTPLGSSPIGFRPAWSTNRHDDSGNLVFSDGHMESVSNTKLGPVFYRAAQP